MKSLKNMSLEDVIRKMVEHEEQRPGHGYNCSCKDKYLQQAKRIISEIEGDRATVRRNIFYLFGAIERWW